MPANYRAPGVYVEELPISVRPIVGVSTSTAAFVDVFAMGPMNHPVKIFGPGDFQRAFGAISPFSESGYAIDQFFANGGSQAWVVRVRPDGAAAASATQELDGQQPKSTSGTRGGSGASSASGASGAWSTSGGGGTSGASGGPGTTGASGHSGGWAASGASGTSGASGGGLSDGFVLTAKNEGEWGNAICFGVQYPDSASALTFDLVVGQVVAATTKAAKVKVAVREVFRGLSTNTKDPRFCRTVVNAGSTLVDITSVSAIGRPARTWNRNAPDSTGIPDGSAYISGATPEITGAGLGDLARASSIAHFHVLDGGNDGSVTSPDASALRNILVGGAADGTGMWALDTIAPDIFNILCLPAMALLDDPQRGALLAAAAEFCSDRRAMLLVDPPATQDQITTSSRLGDAMTSYINDLDRHPNAAAYFPRVVVADPAGGTRTIGPSGTVAGIYARTDNSRGVWKAPAGTEAWLSGARPVLTMTDSTSDTLNPIAVNVLRTFPVFNNVVWGARTLDGADLQASQWKYAARAPNGAVYRGIVTARAAMGDLRTQ